MKIKTIQNTYIEAEIFLADRRLKAGETVQLRGVLDSKLGPVYLTEKLAVDAEKSTYNDTCYRWEYDLGDKYILPGTYSFEIVIVQSSGRVIPISHKGENCLVIIPAERGEVYGEVVTPIKNGGTSASTASGARQKLNFIGVNPVNIETDTPSTWISFGPGVAYISARGYITDQPADFGFIENKVSHTGLISQTWQTQSGKGTIFKRSGTINGWYEASWTEAFDSKSYIPPQNGGVGANTSVDMGEAEHLECVNRYVAEMNRVAGKIGMRNSTFKTPSGNCSNPINKAKAPVNTGYNSYTTAFDMMCLLAAARHAPSVLSAMSSKTYKYKKNGGDYSETHGILGMSGWYNWADKNGYTLLAAKGGSLTGSYGEIGTKGILNYAMLIKTTIEGRERVFGVTIVGLTLSEGYTVAQKIIKGLIDKFSGAPDDASITEAANRTEFPVGMMVTDLTTSVNFEEDIQRIDGTKAGYRYHYNKDVVRAAASLNKILNAIVAVAQLDNHYISVNYDDFVAGADADKVVVGDVVTTYDALHVMMLRSCNAYATMLARDIGKRLPPVVT